MVRCKANRKPSLEARQILQYPARLAYPRRFHRGGTITRYLRRFATVRALDRRLRYYTSRPLLCIDEIGYLSYDARNADLLFQVVSRRYERKSLILTTNLAFSDWPTIFPNAACTTALIDRVVHHAEIIAIEGDSYRRREAQAARPSRHPQP